MTRSRGLERVMLNTFQIKMIDLRMVTIVCLSLAFLADCSSKSNASPQSQQAAAVPVTVAKVRTKEMPVEINSIGNIEPVFSVDAKAQVTGKLLKVHFKEGDYVKKGQLLFTLDARPYVQALKEAQANLKQSQANYKVAQANLSNAQAQFGGAQWNALNYQAGFYSSQGNLESLKALSDYQLSYLKKQKALFDYGVIAENDLETAQSNYKSALAKYLQAAAQVNQSLVQARSASGSGIEQAKAVVEQMQSQIGVAEAQIAQFQAALENAKVQLSYCRIPSPVDGRTGNLNITEGNLINANDTTPIVSINSMSPIYATFSVPERYLSDIQKYSSGGIVRVTAQIDAQTSRVGTLSSLNNEVDPTTGTGQLKASFQNEDNLLYPGRFVQIVLTLTNQPDAIVVPAAAVQSSQQGLFVYVVKDDQTVEMRNVSLDRTIDDEAVISNGLLEGETVVTDGQLRLNPGGKVQIVTNELSNSNSQNSTNDQSNSNSMNNTNGAGQ